ncbi:riboflavin synthase subunit alpha [Cohnella xylanilytica]|uniref:Riboflavin synthase n=1 Tax=Cohnella xylanilytica TaxID=557555 RepID=A0A841TWV7_9BACL|nr:riboflavin synthase [Cohnella xylanilytica]MBB6690114.1 riboflavin synthase [Cohnella xylanilytica]GIO11741.1 riboflavin synthase subunit alpha [Cohnella xylanilytica]
MFTGLIEEIGVLRRAQRRGEAMVLTLSGSKVLEDVKLGDSISVNGVCLTVIAFDGGSFSVDVMPQTFRHTNLSELKPGSPVNLERAMMAGGRFGGHIVQGHVDGTGVIVGRSAEANAVVFTIKPHDEGLLRHVVSQGSITLDGISLTVAVVDREAGTLTVSIIPHTLKETALQYKQAGDTVNVECDILGKYVDHLLSQRGRGASEAAPARGRGGLTEELLRDYGF